MRCSGTEMNDDKDTGGPAFPVFPPVDHATVAVGMSLRDYFAVKALQGLLPATFNAVAANYEDRTDEISTLFAKTAYEFADAMLKARQPISDAVDKIAAVLRAG